jgi:hypothetical protein
MTSVAVNCVECNRRTASSRGHIGACFEAYVNVAKEPDLENQGKSRN